MKESSQFYLFPVALLAGALLYLGYGPDRSASAPLLIGYGVAFAAYVWNTWKVEFTWRHLMILAIGIRVSLLLAPVSWTDDHFRYIWDGLCSVNGISPYAFTPEELTLARPQVFTPSLYAKLNSPLFHSVYPPLAQLVFALASFIGDGDAWRSTIALRVIVVAFDVAAILALGKLVGYAPRSIAVYALNPLVIMELSVNVHTEALMIAPMLWSVILIRSGRYDASAAILALAAAARLWPLLILTWIPIRLGPRQSIQYIIVCLVIFTTTWIPFFSTELYHDLTASLALFTNYLEFNGAFYEFFRALFGNGLVKGTGVLSAMTLLAIVIYVAKQWRKRSVDPAEAMLWILAIHLFGSQVVHPWYILPLIAFAAATGYRWPILWSLLIVVTYLTYASEPYSQPYWWIALEYSLLFAFLIGELIQRKKGTVGGFELSADRTSA